MTESSHDSELRTLSPGQLLAWAEGSAHAVRLRTFRDVIPQGFMAALAPAIVDWERSSPFADNPFAVVRNVNYGGNPLEKTINLQQVHVPLTGIAFAEFILVPSTRGGQHALAHHAQLRFVFEPDSRPMLLDLADSLVGSASHIPDLILSWETWHESSIRYSGFKGLDPSSYRLSMRAYAGPQRFLEDTLRRRPWLAYRLRIPGGTQGAAELLKVVLAIGDGVARDTLSQLLELGEEGWAQNTPPADADPAAKAEWQRLRELVNRRHKSGDDRLVLSNEQQGYQTLVRSCATLARYSVLTAAKRMIHRGCEDGVKEDKVPEPLMSEPAEWMKAVAHTNLWGLFVRAPLALAYIIRNPTAVPEKIPHELAAAGLIERRGGKVWMIKYAHHEKSPYDRSGMYGRDYLD